MTEIRINQMNAVQNEALELFRKKNTDYGDAFATYGTVGVIVRMGDKMQRLLSVSSKGISLVDTESLRDTLIDLHNYAAMVAVSTYYLKLKCTKKYLHQTNIFVTIYSNKNNQSIIY